MKTRAEEPMAVIELLGLPGAGKTTVVEAVASSGSVAVMSRYRRWSNVPTYATAALRLAPRLFRARLSDDCSWKDCNKMVRLESSSAIIRLRARHGFQALVFDQGPLFLLGQLDRGGCSVSSGLGDRRPAIVRRWAQTLDLALVLDAPNDILLDRIRNRDKHHALQDVPEGLARLALEAQRGSIDHLLEELNRQGTVRTLRIDTAASAEVTIEAVRVAIASVTHS